MRHPDLTNEEAEIAISRRALVATGLASLALAAAPASAQEALMPTPRLPAGPNYPYTWTAEPAGNMVIGPMSGDSTPFTLGGVVVDRAGQPIAGARVELWQCDGLGMYHHANFSRPAQRDPGFVAFGWQRADAEGRFAFRTIRIIPCEGRGPHYHISAAAPGRPQLITQLFLPDHPMNARDTIWRRLSPAQQAAVTVTPHRTPQGEAGLARLVLA